MSRPRKADSRVAAEAGPRELTDPRTMRALAHPVRIALLEALTREGPMTATAAGEAVGESPANASFHLRTLAKYGFVEEAGGGSGRSRPWRLVALGTRFRGSDDADAALAGRALEQMHIRRTVERLQEWVTTRDALPAPWNEAGFQSSNIAYLTPDEVEQVGEELTAVVLRYRERTLDKGKRPKDARPVQLVAFGHPLPPMPSGA